MIGAKWFDPMVGVDIHFVFVPTPAGPIPTPLPHPFVGVVFDPAGLIVGAAMSAAFSVALGTPFTGPVLTNMMPAANTGTEGTNKMVVPHFPMPPGTGWAPVPVGPKPTIPGKPPDPPVPSPVPSNDAILITGSKTVYVSGTNACRLGSLAMSCGEPLRLPSTTCLAIPMGPPVLIGGPPALDFMAALMGMIRTQWVSGKLHSLFKAKPGSWRSKLICFLTGHPVDVMTGMVVTDFVDVGLPGPIPFEFERTYYSRSRYDGPLGSGWHHSYDQAIRFEDERIVYRAGDGRDLYFDLIEEGEITHNEAEGYSLKRGKDLITVEGRDRQRLHFRPVQDKLAPWPLVRIENLRGQTIELAYDETGHLTGAVDSAGRTVEFKNDPNGRLTAICLPHPTRDGFRFDAVRFEYDRHGDLVAAIDAEGHVQRYAYKHHLLVQETDRNGHSFYFSYDGTDPDAHCVRTWGDGGVFDHVLTYDFDKHLTVKEDSYGSRTTYYGNPGGLVDKIIDSLGRETTFEYDESFNTVSVANGVGAAQVMEYDARGNITCVTDADGVTRTYEYDEFNQSVCERDAAGSESRQTYNRYGELTEAMNPLGGRFDHEYTKSGALRSITSRLGRRVAIQWDDAHNLLGMQLPGEKPVRFEYDRLGRLSRIAYPNDITVRFERDLRGHPAKVTHSLTGTERYEHDGEGNIRRVEDAAGNPEVYEYGPLGWLLSVRTGRDRMRRFEYDKEGDIVRITNEKEEVTEYLRDTEGQVTTIVGFGGRQLQFEYDDAGHIVAIMENSRHRRDIEWTPGGRLKSVKFEDGCFEEFAYDANGRLAETKNESGTLTFEYDVIGRITKETWNDLGLAHEYNPDDDRVATLSPDGLAVHYDYDENGRLKGVQIGESYKLSWIFDVNGRIIKKLMPGGFVENRTYDLAGHPADHRVDNRDGLLVTARHYDFTPSGELNSLFDRQRGQRAYVFGDRGPTQVLHDGKQIESYRFDITGNRLPDDKPSVIDTGDRLRQHDDIYYEYDEDSRVVKKTVGENTWTFAYNDRSQLIRVTNPVGAEVSFAYDPLGRRVSKVNGNSSVHWNWDGDTVWREELRRGDETSVRHFVFEPGTFTPLALVEGDECFSFVTDHIGTPQELLSGKGKLAWAGDYDTWGRTRRMIEEGVRNPIRFQGQYYDDESGLHYNRHRYYDPDTGRYLTPDPSGISGGFNAYAYPTDPLTWVDPMGLTSCKGRVQEHVDSWITFFRTGIRPKHARALARVASTEGVELAFRKIGWYKRVQSALWGMAGVPPKPLAVKAKVGVSGLVRGADGKWYRCDYDPAFYRKGGRTLSNDEALALNRKLSDAMGEKIQHGTHNTMDQAGVPPGKIAEIGPPGDTTVFKPGGTTSDVGNSAMKNDPSIPWLW